ncbi:MAG TPA: cytochrome c oxidase subunit 3 family protein [Pelomicrobium sp.]|nr:cytochrome c oxidase subunit 3 family protein [Pelomicrobium sp.]
MAAEPRAFVAEQFADARQQRTAATLGMWVFLATEVLFFGVLFAAYLAIRYIHAGAFALGSQHTDLVLGSVNTGVLLTSSLTIALAVRAAALGRDRATTGWLAATMILGTAFLAIKGFEYRQEYLEGLVPFLGFRYDGPRGEGVELFFILYFVMTGLHALHLLIGIAVVGAVAFLNARGRFSRPWHTPVGLTGLYWHFVDVVWIFLFPLFYLVARIA